MVTPGVVVTSGAPRSLPIIRSQTVIGLVGTAEDEPDTNIPANGTLTLVTAPSEIAQFGTTGSIPSALRAIFNNTVSPVIVARFDHDDTDPAARAAALAAAITLLRNAESEIGLRPTFVIAPNETWNSTPSGDGPVPNDTANTVVSALNTLADAIGAIAICAAPPTSRALAISWVANNQNSRVLGVFPHIVPSEDGEAVVDPSSYFAGALARTDVEYGYWSNPALKRISGITRTSPRISFSFDNPTSDAGLLTGANLMAIVPHDGHRMWGSRLMTSATTLFRFLNVRRIEDAIGRQLASANAEAISREIRRGYFDFVSGQVNAFLSILRAQGAILEGICTPDSELNTQANLASGDVYFNLDYTPTIPAQRLNFSVNIRTLGLASI